ncbi:Mu transposase C-terminal domain-containing protein [Brevundimonas sp. M20]|uniref:Mu transposase C-terminal domain-containing protein n=1 Tax=Brevundimonas sp. M20 TaxID=2591463 RepID=UPI001146E234|nr:Mu transposase C-terminal domain-containing protein [Brevundimonas sp. M20]QDH74248.1 DDE-type integrase/transposase/recombinase [Brevundimonas sp. M20]
MTIQFQKGERWTLDGTPILFDQTLTHGLLLFLHESNLSPLQIEDDDGFRTPDTRWALETYAAGRLVRRPVNERSVARRLAQEREYDPATIRKLDPQARLRLFVLRKIDELGLTTASERSIEWALLRIWREEPEAPELGKRPSARSVIRWLERGEPGRRTIKESLSMSGRVPRRPRVDAQIEVLLNHGVTRYWRSPSMSIETAYAKFACRVMRLNRWRERAGIEPLVRPVSETFRLRIRATESYETYALKYGAKKAKSRFKAVAGMMTAQRRLQLGCMDHTSWDAIAVFDSEWMLPIGTPWLTVLIDVRSRCVVGFVLGFEPPSTYSVMECLKRAGMPKTRFLDDKGPARKLVNVFGRFDQIVVDNGKEFAGVSFEDAFADLGTTLRLAPVASPTHKAIVERFFATLNNLITRQLPGARLPIHVMRELGYDPAASAVLTVEQMEDLIWEAIRFYHIEVHSSAGLPPGAIWQQDAERFGIPVHDDLRQIDKMLGMVAEGRQLNRSGVNIHGLSYHDPAVVQGLLNDLAGTAPVRRQRRSGSASCQVKVKFNPANIAEIHVWHHLERRYHTLPCTEERYAQGMSLWHHRKLAQWAFQAGLAFSTEADRLEARARLAARVQQLVPDVLIRKRRSVARVLQKPKQQHLTGVVEMRFAASRHDGMAPIVEQTPLAFSRTDEGLASKRPPRPPAKKKVLPRPSSPDPGPPAQADGGSGGEGLGWEPFK